MSEKEFNYNANQDYSDMAAKSQAVPSFDEYCKNNPNVPLDKVNEERSKNYYSCADNYQMGTIQDNQIYISMTDNQHKQLVNNEPITADRGLSGYFSDQTTIEACKNKDGSLNNTTYNEMCQIAPFRPGGLTGDGDATYKPHVECLQIDRDRLEAVYGTRDFNAAIAKCDANNHFGSGGGNQGFNPHIDELIQNKCLTHVPENSFSDSNFTTSKINEKSLQNSVVPEDKAFGMYKQAQAKSEDAVKNNAPHPTASTRDIGFEHNPNPVQTPTGHATEWKKSENVSTGQTDSNITSKSKQGEADGVRAGPSNYDNKSDLSDKTTLDKSGKTSPQAESFATVKPEDLAGRERSSKETYSPVSQADIAGKELQPKESFSSFTEADLAKRNEPKSNQGTDPTVQTSAVSSGLNGGDYKKSVGTGMGV